MPSDRHQRPRGPHQLPPGRHGLSRNFVALNQRERLLEAVADVVSLVGFQAMSVEDIIGAAGVSRRTFYDHFKSKDDAFLAALDAIGGQLLQGVRGACEGHEDFIGGVIASLESVLHFASSEPRYADLCIVEVLAAGPEAIQRRNDVVRALSHFLHEAGRTVDGGLRPPELTAEAIVGGICEVIYSRVLQGQATELPALLPQLAYSVLLPYIGAAAAKRATRGVRAAQGTRL